MYGCVYVLNLKSPNADRLFSCNLTVDVIVVVDAGLNKTLAWKFKLRACSVFVHEYVQCIQYTQTQFAQLFDFTNFGTNASNRNNDTLFVVTGTIFTA